MKFYRIRVSQPVSEKLKAEIQKPFCNCTIDMLKNVMDFFFLNKNFWNSNLKLNFNAIFLTIKLTLLTAWSWCMFYQNLTQLLYSFETKLNNESLKTWLQEKNKILITKLQKDIQRYINLSEYIENFCNKILKQKVFSVFEKYIWCCNVFLYFYCINPNIAWKFITSTISLKVFEINNFSQQQLHI